jgi:hypothetical protein
VRGLRRRPVRRLLAVVLLRKPGERHGGRVIEHLEDLARCFNDDVR